MKRFFISLFFICVAGLSFAADNSEFTWDFMPDKWVDAPFLGNGEMGTMIYKESAKSIKWLVGNSFAQDHRQEDNYSMRCPEVVNRGRVPVGFFRLKTRGLIIDADIKLDIETSETSGRIKTTLGSIDFKTVLLSDFNLCIIDLSRSKFEKKAAFEFVPAVPESFRLLSMGNSALLEGIQRNPAPVVEIIGNNAKRCVQKFAAGGVTVTAWKEFFHNNKSTLVFSVKHSFPDETAIDEAGKNIAEFSYDNRENLIASHRRWWSDFHNQSSVTLPDPYWNLFYKTQMYKFGAATRRGGAMIDNSGPWLQPSSWNGTWWNLNVQLSYSPSYTANHLEEASVLIDVFKDNFQQLIDNVEPEYRTDSAGLSRNTGMWSLKGKVGVPGGWKYEGKDIGSETGNLTWMCHNFYRHYRSSLDKDLRDNLLYPLLTRAVNYYRHFLYEGEDGYLHLPETHSPEYGNAEDCTYDFSLIRWGCLTLLELNQERISDGLGSDEALAFEWQKILDKLVPFHINENGLMIGKNTGFDKSHRHWSHMLMIYPLRIMSPETGDKELIEQTFARWHSFKNALVGYSYTAGASMSAVLQDGNRALKYLNGFKPYMGYSTMYYEGGKMYWPVMETPLHCATAIQEMLIQFRRVPGEAGFPIDIFPAMPDKWREASFKNLRAEGAFLVSAERNGGATVKVTVTSEKNNSCLIRTDWAGPVKATVTGEATVEQVKDGWQLTMAAGSRVELYCGE